MVIEIMREKHRDMPNLSYVVGDCRSMPQFADCSFSSAIDKGGRRARLLLLLPPPPPQCCASLAAA